MLGRPVNNANLRTAVRDRQLGCSLAIAEEEQNEQDRRHQTPSPTTDNTFGVEDLLADDDDDNHLLS